MRPKERALPPHLLVVGAGNRAAPRSARRGEPRANGGAAEEATRGQCACAGIERTAAPKPWAWFPRKPSKPKINF